MSTTSVQGIGKAIRRTEDRRFITGKGRYTDDVRFDGQTWLAFVRSPYAHAKINAIDASAALETDGVVAVYTGEDLVAAGVRPIPPIWEITNKDGSKQAEPPRRTLAVGKVQHVGDPVAMVIAETPALAREAAELVEVDYDVLEPVIATASALEPGRPQLHEEAPGNQCFHWHVGNEAATLQAFAKAKHVVRLDLINTRIIANPMEPRSAVANYEEATGEYTLYTTSQNPHLVRMLMCGSVLGLPEHKVRVIAPDVGGGFGVKCYHYPEEVAVTWATKACGRPVKWTADRSETFLSDAHGRDHVTHAELALDENGIFLGMRVDTVANLGAYLSTWGPSIPTYLYAPMLAGQYLTPAIYAEVRGVFTNTLPVDAYRGAGRPEANYVVERLVDAAAQQLGIDRAEIRRRNFIPADAMPYQTPVNLIYDSGHFEKCMDRALAQIDYAGFEARRAEARARGKLRGIGFSCYIEACGLSPSRASGRNGARIGLYESAEVRFNPDGSVSLFTGTHSHGQGHETAFAQIISGMLGVPFDQVEVIHGDTARTPFGMGTYGSRSAAVGGSAIVVAVNRVIEKGKKISAHMLEADPGDITFEDGRFSVQGTDHAITIAEVARSAYIPHNYPLETLDPGLDETAFYDPTNFTFPNGTQVCELEVDPKTGEIIIERFVVVDDFGRIINPMIVEGQVQGGLAQGIGQALLEQVVYDEESGQLLTGSFMDYAMPRAGDLLDFESSFHEDALCTHNPLGVKGCGESGTIGGATAVMNAVIDALRDYGITHFDMPASSQRVWNVMRNAPRQPQKEV